MKSVKFIQVAHLYLGCIIKNVKDDSLSLLTMATPSDLNTLFLNGMPKKFPNENYKPILKGFDQFSERDIIDWIEYAIGFINDENEIKSIRELNNDNIGYMVNEVKKLGLNAIGGNPKLMPHLVCFLAYRRYDLFDLINNGEAIKFDPTNP